MHVAVGEDDETGIQGASVLAGLLLCSEQVFTLCFSFEDKEWEALRIEEQEVDKPPLELLEVIAESV